MSIRRPLATALLALALALSFAAETARGDLRPLVVGGTSDASPADSPEQRIDPNTRESRFGGVGSLHVEVAPGESLLGSAVLLSPYHVLTAAHCFDIDNDGAPDVAPGQATFHLNYGGDRSHSASAALIAVHPDYHGFGTPFINDDLALLILSEPIFDAPTYPLLRDSLAAGAVVTFAGYGRGGDGVAGYTVSSSLTVKRFGQNVIDYFEPDDERLGGDEVYGMDFDRPDGSSGPNGGPSLGNDLEAIFGPGDSGSPAFVERNGRLYVAGINTYSSTLDAVAPLFGSGGGGILVSGALAWLDTLFPLPGDADFDRQVTSADYTIWASHFGLHAGDALYADGDFNYDGFVDGADLTIWTDNFGLRGLPVAIPEPAGILLAAALAGFARFLPFQRARRCFERRA